MTELHAALAARVDDWRAGGYAHDRFPAITEILRYAVDGEDPTESLPGVRIAPLPAGRPVPGRRDVTGIRANPTA